MRRPLLLLLVLLASVTLHGQTVVPIARAGSIATAVVC